MKKTRHQWPMLTLMYWLSQFLLIIIGAAAVILIVTAVIGQQSLMEVVRMVLNMVNV
jgi:hypothetical protein